MTQVTKMVTLGTSMVSIYARTHATVAMAAITIDMLSGNRTIIGLGASTPDIVENWHGMKFERPVSRMREYIECLSLLITGENVNYNGKLLKVNNLRIMHQPQRTYTPIVMADINNK